MIVDSSALVALVFREPGFERIERVLGAAPMVGVSAATLVETGIVLSARLQRDARPIVRGLAETCRIAVIPFDEAHYAAAMSAWLRFGKGRHPASLNFGDCISYATAAVSRRPLLCVGDDFPRTDLELVA